MLTDAMVCARVNENAPRFLEGFVVAAQVAHPADIERRPTLLDGQGVPAAREVYFLMHLEHG